MCDKTSTNIRDFIITMFLIFPIALIVGFFTVQSLWSVAPIPSATYPGVLYTWPIQATIQSIFISPKAAEFFRVEGVFYGFLAGALLYVVGDFLKFAPFVVGIAGGMASPIPPSISILLGAVIGEIISGLIGKERWTEYRGVVFAGILLGEGLIITIGAGLAIIMKSMWAFPY